MSVEIIIMASYEWLSGDTHIRSSLDIKYNLSFSQLEHVEHFTDIATYIIMRMHVITSRVTRGTDD